MRLPLSKSLNSYDLVFFYKNTSQGLESQAKSSQATGQVHSPLSFRFVSSLTLRECHYSYLVPLPGQVHWEGLLKQSVSKQIMFIISPMAITILTSSLTLLPLLTLLEPNGPPSCALSVLGMLHLRPLFWLFPLFP